MIKRRILLAELTPRVPLPQVFARWNPADKHADITLSGSDLVANKSTTHATNWACVRSTLPVVVGQWYWETTITYSGAADFGVGMLWRSSPGEWLSSDPGVIAVFRALGIAVNRAGQVRAGGDLLGSIGAVLSGDVIRHWIDFDAGIYRIARGAGAWLSVSREDLVWFEDWPDIVRMPVAGILRPAGSTCTIATNFGRSPFAHAVPDGANAGIYTEPSAATSIYLGSEGFDATIAKVPVHFMGRIAADQDVEIEREGSCWVWGGQSISRRGQLVVINNDGALDDWRDYLWREAPVVLRAGWEGDPYSAFEVWAYSRVDTIELTRDARIVLSLADPVAWLDQHLQRDLYPADQANLQLAGQPVPIVYGAPLYCTPAKLSTNPFERDYQLVDSALTTIAAVYDSGDIFAGPDDAFAPHAAITAANGGDFGGWSGAPALPGNWVLPLGAGFFTQNDRFADGGGGYMLCISKQASVVEMMHAASTLQARRRYRITFECTAIHTNGALIFRVPGSPDVSVSLTSTGVKSVALYTRAAGQLRMVMQGDGIHVYIRTLRVAAEQVVDWTYWGGTRGFSLANTPAGKVVANPENMLGALNWIVDDIAARTRVPTIDLGDAVLPGVDIGSVSRLFLRHPYLIAAYLDKPVTGLALLRSILDGWCGSVTSNRLGQIVVGRVEEPSYTAVLQLDSSNIIGDVAVTTDRAKNLTIRLAGAQNHTVHTAAEIATGVPTELATALQTEYLHTVEGAPLGDQPVSSAYAAAIAAPAQVTPLQRVEDLQKEANRVATLFRPQRKIYQFPALLDASAADALEPWQTVRLVWPRWGLDGGKNLLVVGVRSRFFARRVDLKLWG